MNLGDDDPQGYQNLQVSVMYHVILMIRQMRYQLVRAYILSALVYHLELRAQPFLEVGKPSKVGS